MLERLAQMFFVWMRPETPGRPRAPAPILAPTPAPVQRPAPPAKARASRRPKAARKPSPRVQAYEHVVAAMLAQYGVKVRKWRKNMSGIARETRFEDGRIVRTLESPRPRTPLSMAIFLHEIGHHAIGFGVYKPRCLEEYHAWKFALDQMEAHGLEITDKVRDRMRRSLEYAVGKASRRGLRELPPELHPFAAQRRSTGTA
jgi:hypothetical protein